MPKILVAYGRRLGQLGRRETRPAGHDDRLACIPAAKSKETGYIIINPAGFTHTSVARYELALKAA